MIKVSLIVPTYNRANFLEQALTSFLNQTLSAAEYEILIIDNNSNDDTKLIVERVMKTAKCPWSYLFEPRQGLHHARNKGIDVAKGEIIVFGDDDIKANERWLEEIKNEFDKNNSTGIAGGIIQPEWGAEPADWVYDYGSKHIHPVFAYLDYGKERLLLIKDDHNVYGCNFAIRRNLAIQIGGSYPDTYPNYLKHLSGPGEYGMICEVRTLNYDVVYLPEAIVHHYIHPSRISLNYFKDRYERWAIEEVFKQFRDEPNKAEAATNLIDSTLEKFEQIQEDSRTKLNPEYYEIIMKAYVYQKTRQIISVLTDPSLYEHIVKENYF